MKSGGNKNDRKEKVDCDCGIVCGDVCSHVFYARQMRQNRMQKDIAKEILRLHVVANSDSKKDQALKMEVKEAVVTYLRGVMQDAESVDEARIQIQKRLPEIEAVAKEKMQQKGYSYDADATLSSCYFPVKTYGDMIFPAGEYEALKVNLGKSAGKNWWCVMYPTLCLWTPHTRLCRENPRKN